MQGKTPKKATNESMLDFSIPREKLFPLHTHKRTPSLRLKESLASSTLFQEPIITSRKESMVSWGLPKTPQRAPIEISDLQVSNLVSKIPNTTKHSRSNSTLQQANLTAKEGFFSTAKPKKQTVEVQSTPKRSQGKMAALKELYQVPILSGKKPPQVNISRNSMSLIPTEFMSPKNEKDPRESIDNLLGSLKGVVFSDTKNRLGKYQRRFLELNGDATRSVVETISTPKPISKREEGTPKAQSKTNSKQSQMLAQALSQCLSLKSPSRGPSRAGTPCQITPRDEKEIFVEKLEKEKIFPSTVKHHKRGMSWGQMPVFPEVPLVIERGSAKVTKEDLAQLEKERMRAAEDELEQFNKFLCIDMQTFDFEKAMIMRREAKKNNKMNSVAVMSGGNNGEVDVRDRDTMLRSMFAYYSKESEKPASTGESTSKNQQGSTTCNSSKLASEVLEIKRERKKKGQDEDREMEQFLEMLENNQKSTKRRSYKQEEF